MTEPKRYKVPPYGMKVTEISTPIEKKSKLPTGLVPIPNRIIKQGDEDFDYIKHHKNKFGIKE